MPRIPGRPERSTRIYVHRRRRRRRCRSAPFAQVRAQRRAARRQPPGPVPGGDALVQPGRRAWRSAQAVDAHPADAGASSACRRRLDGSFQGTAQAFQASLAERAAADPGGHPRHLHRARHALRELHPPDHHPVHPALGRRRRAAGADGCSSFELSVIALIGILLLIGIVKKNAIMMIDFALEAERERGQDARARPSTRPACCASGRS